MNLCYKIMNRAILVKSFIFSLFSIMFFEYALGEPSKKTAFAWPAYRDSYPQIKALSSVFGESRGSRFHNGIDLAGSNIALYPLAQGEILHSRQAGDDPYAPQAGPGNWLFLNHGNGWTSGYHHLQEDSSALRKGIVDVNTIIGKAGNTGRSGGAHLHLFLTNRISRKIVNPLLYLPPIEDKTAPRMGYLVIKTPQSTTRLSHRQKESIRMRQNWPVYLEAEDRSQNKKVKMGLYRLSWSLNENNSWERTFEELRYHDGKWLLNEMAFDEVFEKGLYSLGQLPFIQGDNYLKIEASDYNGNSSEVLFQIHVNKEY